MWMGYQIQSVVTYDFKKKKKKHLFISVKLHKITQDKGKHSKTTTSKHKERTK